MDTSKLNAGWVRGEGLTLQWTGGMKMIRFLHAIKMFHNPVYFTL